MNARFDSLLDELRADGLALSGDEDVPIQNMRCVSVPSAEPVTAEDVIGLVRAALAIRREQVMSQSIRPVSFYVWHDEMAGQLRFSTAPCARDALPFRARVRLVDELREIVTAFMQSTYRDGIPLSEFALAWDEPTVPADSYSLAVWAEEWR